MLQPHRYFNIGIGSNYATAEYGITYQSIAEVHKRIKDGEFLKVFNTDDGSTTFYRYSQYTGYTELN